MSSEPFRFFVFTCRDPATDFRLALVDALRRHYDTYYIWLRRRPVVSGPSTNGALVEMSLPAFLCFMLGFRQDGKVNIYFNSTNTYFPAMITLLRGLMTAGVWCLDMHDNLRYHRTGLERLRTDLIVSLLRRLSHVTVHAAPTLRDMYPDSLHLGNASHIQPLGHTATTSDGVLIVASFDERFDYDFLAGLAQACPTTPFHLHGWTKSHANTLAEWATIAEIAAIAARHDNVHYHGAYTTADLPAILSRFQVSVAPYRIHTDSTRYIDPLRFYHCLNAGLEVIATDIPQAQCMRAWVHIVSSVTDCAATLAAIQAGRLAKQPAYSPITWEQKADRLVQIVRAP